MHVSTQPLKPTLVSPCRIWEHLLEIAEFGDTTIIITTHYIEEARQANMVGLMRQGRILAEANPELLVQRYEEQVRGRGRGQTGSHTPFPWLLLFSVSRSLRLEVSGYGDAGVDASSGVVHVWFFSDPGGRVFEAVRGRLRHR